MPEQPGSAEAVVPLAGADAIRHAAAMRAKAGSRSRAAAIGWLLDGPGWPWLAGAVDVAGVGLGAGVAARMTDEGPDARAVLVGAAAAVLALALARTRARQLDAGLLDDVRPLLTALAVAQLVTVAAAGVLGDGSIGTGAVAVAWLATTALVVAGLGVLKHVRRFARRHGLAGQRTVIVGAGVVGRRLARRLEAHPEYGLRPVGFVDWKGANGPLLGAPDEVAAVLDRTGARHLALAFARRPDADLLPLIRVCAERGVDVVAVPRLFDGGDRRAPEAVGGLPLIRVRSGGFGSRRWLRLKDVADRAFAVLALVALAPLMGVIWVAIAATTGGPAVFRQRRVSRDGHPFDLLKFRTMSDARAEAVEAAPDPRLDRAPGGAGGTDRRTRIGRLLRRTSVDELPQLVNVLRGEMSLVGPRPERPEFVTVFAETVPRYDERHRMRAGLTGLAQVNGLRGPTSLTERVELDNFYIDHWSPGLDAKILARTVLAIVRAAE